jgi:hypothetical protein
MVIWRWSGHRFAATNCCIFAMTGMPYGEITGMEAFPDVSLLNKPMTRTALMRAVEQAVKPAV